MLWDFSVSQCFSIIARTWPFLILRVIVFGAFAVIFAVLTASGGVIGHELGPNFTDLGATQTGLMGGVAGIGLAILVLRILREYTLYLVKAGHIAVMGEMMDGARIPANLSQVGMGARTVKENFAEASVLFVLDQLIKGVLKVIESFFKRIGSLIPFISPILSLLESIITIAVTYVDEMILAHIMRTRPANVWRAGADALVIYAQNAKLMFKNAFWLAMFLIIFEVTIFAAIYFLLPLPDFVDFTIEGANGARMAAGIIGVVLVAGVFVEPFSVCAMLQVFNKVARTQTPDPEVERRLAERSEEFRDLRDGRPDGLTKGFQPAE
ncbi:MAG: hypothetical protein AAFR39_04170 [Pseudomonadota bacterium]